MVADRHQRWLHVSRAQTNGSEVLLVYDIKADRLVPELTDFSVELSIGRRLSPLTVGKRVMHVISFCEHVGLASVEPRQVTTKELRDYRDKELERVAQRSASRDRILAAKRTVNEKLVSILQWLEWRWLNRSVELGLVTSAESERASQSQFGLHISDLAFRRVGAAARHKASYIVDEAQLDNFRLAMMASRVGLYSRQRNLLIADIANTMGLRRASINSLCVSQFNREAIQRERRSFVMLRPSSQKFSYEIDYPCPVSLALRVCDFIDKHRQTLIAVKRAGISIHQDRVFLSARDGRPLTERAITQIFSKHMRALGAPKGVAIHALRAKFANDRIQAELANRIARGMDTSTESIASAVAMSMGHRSTRSLYAYVAAAQSAGALSGNEASSKGAHEVRAGRVGGKGDA